MADALQKAVEELQSSLLQYLHKRLPEFEQAQDLLQEVFLKAVRAQNAGTDIDNPNAWLRTAARNALVDYYRRRSLNLESLEHEPKDITEDDYYLHQRLSTSLLPFVKELDPKYRDTLIAVDFDGNSMAQVAKQQGVSVSAVKSRAARGRRLLKQKILNCCHVDTENGWVSDYYPLDK